MKPSKLGGSAALGRFPSNTASTSPGLSVATAVRIRGGDQPPSPPRSLPERERVRGGSTQTALPTSGKTDYDVGESDVEYEYFEVEDDGDNAEEGYYYVDDYYEGEDDNVITYLPDVEDAWPPAEPAPKPRLLLPLASRSTLSVAGALPALMPAALSTQFGRAFRVLSNYVPGNLNVEAGALVTVALLSMLALARALTTSPPPSLADVSNKKRKRQKKNMGRKRTGVSHQTQWKNLLSRKRGAEKKRGHNATVYVDHPVERDGDGDEEIVDLDLQDCDNASTEQQCSASLLKRLIAAAARVPRAARGTWIKTIATRDVQRHQLDGAGATKSDPLVEAASKSEDPLAGRQAVDNYDQDQEGRNALQQKLDTLADSHETLGQEYDAALRMLHKARLEVRRQEQLLSKQEEESQLQEQQQKQQLEAAVADLEATHETQMQEEIQRLRAHMETELHSEIEAKLTKTLTSKFQDQHKEDLVAEQTKLREEINRRLDMAKREVEETERKKSHEELLRIREGIQIVLDRERRLMKEQVRRVTERVREWVVKEQQERLLAQARQLQEEAESFGSRGVGKGGNSDKSIGAVREGPRQSGRASKRTGERKSARPRQRRQGGKQGSSSRHSSQPRILRDDYDKTSRNAVNSGEEDN